MSIQQAVLGLGILSTLIPVVAVLIRGRSRHMTVATILTAASTSVLLFSALRLVIMGPQPVQNFWVYGVMGFAVPVALAGYLLAVGFGRDNPDASFRDARPTFILLGLTGIVFLTLLRHGSFVTGYDWASGRGTIHIGGLGKAFLTYLLVAVVAAGQALEKTYRAAQGNLRHRLRLPMFGFFGFLAYATFVLTVGMLYSSIGLGKLVTLALPVAFGSLLIGYGYVRGAIMDVATPVSREIVYSSFTAFAAGLFVIAVGIAAQVATLTKWTPDEILVLAFGFVAALIAVLMLVSNRFQRMVRRFIDRNFYVNRYDYRAQWSKVTEALSEATDQGTVLELSAKVLRDTFLADAVTISLEDPPSGTIRPIHGRGVGDPQAVLGPNCPLCEELLRGRKSLLLERKADDFTFIPIYAENREWLERTASQIVAPFLSGNEFFGIIGLERAHGDDPFTFEDVALLDRVAAHIASALRAHQLAAELAETREMELMSQWSHMIVHDLKNHITPLRMVAKNLIDRRDRPDIAEICARDLSRVADRMEALVQTLRELRENPTERRTRVVLGELAREVLSDLQARDHAAIEVETQLESCRAVLADGGMLRRVIENLVTNAIEAMDGQGRLLVATRDEECRQGSMVILEVTDSGPGIPEEFLRERLFRPFATTKKKGLGLGLYQCRSIIQAHGGELTVTSQVGEGATFRVALPAAPPTESEEENRVAEGKKTPAMQATTGALRGQQLFSTSD